MPSYVGASETFGDEALVDVRGTQLKYAVFGAYLTLRQLRPLPGGLKTIAITRTPIPTLFHLEKL